MIFLDTNVISALMRPDVEPVIVRWFDTQPHSDLWITSITVFEVLIGLEILPVGKKRAEYQNAFEQVLQMFENRVADLDQAAAREAVRAAGVRRRTGLGVDERDMMIAGIALAHRGAVATRNQKDFSSISGLKVIDPTII